MGTSPRSRAASAISNDAGSLYNNANTDYSGFKYNYGIGDQENALNQLQKAQEEQIGRTASTDVATAQGDAAARLASQGMGAGSAYNQQVEGAASPIFRAKFNALSGLASNRLGQQQSLMNEENQRQFGLMASKYNALRSLLGSRSEAASQLDNTTPLDDILAGGKTIGNLALGYPGAKQLVNDIFGK